MPKFRKSQLKKIENVLLKHKANPGITTKAIARIARVPRETVGKRVYDLREHYTIQSNYRNVDGKRTLFYRLVK